MGDFSFDWSAKNHPNYAFENYYNDFNKVFGGFESGMVNFPTWSRTVNSVH
jgi:hypothetical protein